MREEVIHAQQRGAWLGLGLRLGLGFALGLGLGLGLGSGLGSGLGLGAQWLLRPSSFTVGEVSGCTGRCVPG